MSPLILIISSVTMALFMTTLALYYFSRSTCLTYENEELRHALQLIRRQLDETINDTTSTKEKK